MGKLLHDEQVLQKLAPLSLASVAFEQDGWQ